MGISIHLDDIGKHFIREWVFRHITLSFHQGQRYALTGHNGSGKSTLCHLLMGMIPPSEGTMAYKESDTPIAPDDWHRYIAMAAPYQELIEEFTLDELLDFHAKFRPWQEGFDKADFLRETRLEKSLHKPVTLFSSGMKQRVRLGLAFYGKAKVILLDEPTSNLDADGKKWYAEQMDLLDPQALLIISSNDVEEYRTCGTVIDITAYK